LDLSFDRLLMMMYLSGTTGSISEPVMGVTKILARSNSVML